MNSSSRAAKPLRRRLSAPSVQGLDDENSLHSAKEAHELHVACSQRATASLSRSNGDGRGASDTVPRHDGPVAERHPPDASSPCTVIEDCSQSTVHLARERRKHHTRRLSRDPHYFNQVIHQGAHADRDRSRRGRSKGARGSSRVLRRSLKASDAQSTGRPLPRAALCP